MSCISGPIFDALSFSASATLFVAMAYLAWACISFIGAALANRRTSRGYFSDSCLDALVIVSMLFVWASAVRIFAWKVHFGPSSGSAFKITLLVIAALVSLIFATKFGLSLFRFERSRALRAVYLSPLLSTVIILALMLTSGQILEAKEHCVPSCNSPSAGSVPGNTDRTIILA